MGPLPRPSQIICQVRSGRTRGWVTAPCVCGACQASADSRSNVPICSPLPRDSPKAVAGLEAAGQVGGQDCPSLVQQRCCSSTCCRPCVQLNCVPCCAMVPRAVLCPQDLVEALTTGDFWYAARNAVRTCVDPCVWGPTGAGSGAGVVLIERGNGYHGCAVPRSSVHMNLAYLVVIIMLTARLRCAVLCVAVHCALPCCSMATRRTSGRRAR